jgi:hypothetical protein
LGTTALVFIPIGVEVRWENETARVVCASRAASGVSR